MPAEVALGTAAVAYPVIYQCCRYLLPQAGRRILALVLAAIFFGFFFGAGIFTPSDDKTLGLSLGMVLLGAGIAMLVVTVGRISLQYSLLSQQCLALAAASIALILSGPLTAPFVVMTVQDLPSIADAILYRLDHLLGLRSLTTFSSMLLMNEHLRWVVGVAYKSLLWPILAAGLSEAIFAPKRAKGLSLRFLIAPCLGFPLYYLVPAIGPAYYHGDLFPFDMPIGQEHPEWVKAPIATVRNAMPSLHATWAILCFLALRYSPVWHRFLGAIFLCLTLIATLGLGEHYVVDWLGALPLVLLVRGVCSRSLPLGSKERRAAIGAGAALLFGWVLIVRFSPAALDFVTAIRAYCIASLVLPIALEHALAKAEKRHTVDATEAVVSIGNTPQPDILGCDQREPSPAAVGAGNGD